MWTATSKKDQNVSSLIFYGKEGRKLNSTREDEHNHLSESLSIDIHFTTYLFCIKSKHGNMFFTVLLKVRKILGGT